MVISKGGLSNLKVRAYFDFPTTHLLNDDNKAICGSNLKNPFGDVKATVLDYDMVNCKKCRKKHDKNLSNEQLKD